ncbi:hypothetical protein [Psychrobacter sp. 72-O-c]|uniref:hypothetical protein n=1 Tax=Psychrobacter sp. 72-O-c TaxID=2774125 RepID=UPI00191A6520|nr:hypothetical protein [Psychrobacter sp. 72-O-c]
MINNTTTFEMSTRNKAMADELARVAAYAHMLGQLCELSPNAEPLSLEQLEIIFKDISQVTGEASESLITL